MLAIRMQRTGRSGHAQFRVVVQDSRFSPTSGRVVAYAGSYNPHTKEAKLDGEKISQYLANGAQPSDRVAQLLKKEGIKLPDWVKEPTQQKRSARNPEKLRSGQPEAPAAPAADAPAENTAEAEDTQAAPAETPAEESAATEEATAAAEEPQAEETSDAPAEETKQPAVEPTSAETPPDEPAA